MVRPLRFPLGAPNWPGGVERPPAPSRTGVDFDREWARRPAARVTRAALLEGVVRPAVRLMASPEVVGVERLDAVDAPAIFAANHHSHLDTALLLSALPPRFRHRIVVAAAADYFFPTRGKGAMNALVVGAVPVERQRVNRRSSDTTAALLDDGWSLVIFPEGGRSPDGWGQEFRGGAAYLAQKTARPVVPVYLGGTGSVWPKGQKLPKRAPTGTVKVIIGSPLPPIEGESARRLAVRLEQAVAALGDEARTDWWSARQRAATGDTPPLTGPEAAPWRRVWALGAKPLRRG
jgi:1-acyl-sn-glycerol-3-phosphate acyltransferase